MGRSPHATPRVLVVEPDPRERQALVGELSRAGLEPRARRSLAGIRPSGWDVVLARWPTELPEEPPPARRPWIVALVEAGVEGVIENALAAGCDDCLVTPAEPGEAALRSRIGLLARAGRPADLAPGGVDPLTRLRDHAGFRSAIEAEAALDGPLGLVLVDVTGLSRINAAVGPAVADGALREVARRLAALAGPADALGRVDGGTFAWLLPGADLEQTRDAGTRARRAVAAIHIAHWGPLTVATGIAARGAGQLGASALYREAETTLRRAEASDADAAIGDADGAATRAARALAMAITTKDPAIDHHSTRVAELTVRIGTALGWRGPRLARMHSAALLHDVGKLAIRQEILSKSGPLTPGERADMRRHPEVGAAIVRQVLGPDEARWVRHHHERWDGGGYPDGLAGEDIPEEARVIAIADAWDAMTAGRVYRAPVESARAAAEMRRCAGAQFWTPGVRALLDVVAAMGGLVEEEEPEQVSVRPLASSG